MLAGVVHATAMRPRGSKVTTRLRLGCMHCCAPCDLGRGDTAQLCSTRSASAMWRNGRAATAAWEWGDSGEAGATVAPGLLLLLHLVWAMS